MSLTMYRAAYPRSQFVRADWQNLNGECDFRFDDDNVGEGERWFESFSGTQKIQVPFVYETKASGIGEAAFHPNIWYDRIKKVNLGE